MYAKISALAARSDEDSTRELVQILEHADPSVRLEAARALADREIPAGLRVWSLLFDHRSAGPEHLVRWPLKIAAASLLKEPNAFELAEPLLKGDLRTEVLLSAVEDVLVVAANAQKPVLPDPRFWEAALPFIAHPRLDYIARLVHDGFRYFDGEDVEPPVVRVELGEMDDPMLPMLIAGFVVNEAPDTSVLFAPPPGLVLYAHQYGGLSCLHTAVFGYALELDPGVSSSVNFLAHEWSLTHGEPLVAGQLATLSTLLGIPFDAGHEAFVTARSHPPPHGHRVLRAKPEAPWRRVTEPREGHIYLASPYGDDHDRALRKLGAPYVTLLWGNSD